MLCVADDREVPIDVASLGVPHYVQRIPRRNEQNSALTRALTGCSELCRCDIAHSGIERHSEEAFMARISPILLTLFILTFPVPAIAQDTSFSELRDSGEIQKGQTIYVTDGTGERVKGAVQDLSRTSLTVITGRNQSRTFQPSNVARIQRSDSVANGLLIGLAGGVAGAFIARNSICDLPDSECEVIVNAVVGLPIVIGGGVIGAVTDMLIKKTIFTGSSWSRSARIGVSPLVSRSRRGVSMVLAF